MTSAHLINRLPSKTLDFQSPIGILENLFPEVRLKTGLPVKIFGCVAYVHNPVHKKNKWSTKALKCVFLGYSNTQKGFKIYHPITRKYMVSKDVIFDEKSFYYKTTGGNNLRDVPLITSSTDNTIQEKISDPVTAETTLDTPDFHLHELNDESRREENVQDEINKNVQNEINTEELQEVVTPYPKYYTRR